MVIQTTVFPLLPRLPVVPDLILVLTVYLGLRHHGVGGAMGAFLFGYFLTRSRARCSGPTPSR